MADVAIVAGNSWTASTYAPYNSNIYPIKECNFDLSRRGQDKDFERARRSFAWMGSSGLVHKGLDLLLEVFSRLPEVELYVLGSLDSEEDFVRLYHKELFDTPNIYSIGRVDIRSTQFTEVTDACAYVIYPSCSEGQSGSVVTCMYQGLIPIVSQETGVDVSDFGIMLDDCRLETIRQTVLQASSVSPDRCRELAEQTLKEAKATYSRQ